MVGTWIYTQSVREFTCTPTNRLKLFIHTNSSDPYTQYIRTGVLVVCVCVCVCLCVYVMAQRGTKRLSEGEGADRSTGTEWNGTGTEQCSERPKQNEGTMRVI